MASNNGKKRKKRVGLDAQLYSLEMRLSRVNHNSTPLDKTRTVAKLVRATTRAGQQHPRRAKFGRCLPIVAVRPWLRRFYGVNISAAGVGALVDQLPDCVDAAAWDSATAPRRLDFDLLLAFMRQLGDISNSMDARKRCASAKQLGDLEARRRARLAAEQRRPKSAPAAVHRTRLPYSRADEMCVLPQLMVRLLAAALHHPPGALGKITGKSLTPPELATLLRRRLHLDLSQHEQATLRAMIPTAPTEGFAFGDATAQPEDPIAVSGKKLSALLYELRSKGLRKSRVALMASAMASLRCLHSLGISGSLLANLGSCCASFFGRACVATDDATSADALKATEDLLNLERMLSLAAAKLKSLDDVLASGAAAVENALRQFCRSYFARLDNKARKKNANPDARRRPSVAREEPPPRTLFCGLAASSSAVVSSFTLITKDDTERRPSMLLQMRMQLQTTHMLRAQRAFVDKLERSHMDSELHRLERIQQKHFRLSARNYWQNDGMAPIREIVHKPRTNAVMAWERSEVEDAAAKTITRLFWSAMFRISRRRLNSASDEWTRLLETRAHATLVRSMRAWLARKASRVKNVTPEMRARASRVIYRNLERCVHQRRAKALLQSRRRVQKIVQRARDATDEEQTASAARIQAAWRACRVRTRSRELLTAREEDRVIRVDVVRASNLIVADSKTSSSDPFCYVGVYLGQRGGYAPVGMAPSRLAQSQVATVYSSSPFASALHSGVSFQAAAKQSSSTHSSPFNTTSRPRPPTLWLPPNVRARNYDKYEAVPALFPIFASQTCHRDETLHPRWNASFTVPGVDPECRIVLTVVDKDVVGKDDFLGQAIVDLHSLRDRLFARCRSRVRRRSGDLVVEATRRLESQKLPVIDKNHCEITFETVWGGPDRGQIVYCVSACPRALSICSFLEQRLARNSMVAFWKGSWCALGFGQLLVFNSRGDNDPRFTFDVSHIEKVDVLREVDDEVYMTFKVAGGSSHIFRVPEIGYPNHEVLLHAWIRRLRRACPRIPTNEFVPSDCTHGQYVGTEPLDQDDWKATVPPFK